MSSFCMQFHARVPFQLSETTLQLLNDISFILLLHFWTSKNYLFQVNTQQFGNFHMVRLRNPWGDDAEWNGDWSDK